MALTYITYIDKKEWKIRCCLSYKQKRQTLFIDHKKYSKYMQKFYGFFTSFRILAKLPPRLPNKFYSPQNMHSNVLRWNIYMKSLNFILLSSILRRVGANILCKTSDQIYQDKNSYFEEKDIQNLNKYIIMIFHYVLLYDELT